MTAATHPEHGASGGLRLRGLGAGYGGDLVLRDVDLHLRPGSIVGVIGPNGSGKSTLLRAVVGLAPEIVGMAELDGSPTRGVHRRIAYVPQRETVDWSFPITVTEVVRMGLYPELGLIRRAGRDQAARVREAMRRVGIEALGNRQIGALSGGQQQRAFLARALVQDASVLLLDEPMTGVDRATEQAIEELMRSMRDDGALIVLTTHDLESAAALCDQLAFVNHGIVAFGPPSVTFTPPILHATFGGELLIVDEGGDHTHVHAGGHHDVGSH